MRRRSVLVSSLAGIISLAFLLLPVALYRTPEQAIRFNPSYRVVDPAGAERTLSEDTFLQAFRNPSYVPGIYRITATLSLTASSTISGDYFYLVFPYIAGTAMSVSWNGHFIGAQGDMARGNSNIWNSAKILAVPTSFLASMNTLEVAIQGPYEAGLPRMPYLLSQGKGAFFIACLNFFSEKIVLMIIGALAVLGLVLILTGSGSYMKPNAMLFLGLASISTLLFLSDFMTLKALFIPLLTFKRAVAVLRHLSAILFLIGFTALNPGGGRRFNRFFIALQSLCILLLFLPRTMIGMKAMYSWTFLTIILLPVYLMFWLLSRKNFNESHMVLVGGVAIASVMAIRDTLLSFLGRGAVYLSHYGFCVMIMAAAGFIVREILNQNQRLVAEQARAAHFKEESVHDPLTGTYNRAILEEVQRSLSCAFSMLVIDINDLKSINDQFGHAAGDAVLRDAAATMVSLVRKEDIIVRTGGDEFLIILPKLTPERLKDMTQELRRRVESSPIRSASGSGSFFYSISMGSATHQREEPVSRQIFEQLVESADLEMYSEKEKYRQRKSAQRA